MPSSGSGKGSTERRDVAMRQFTRLVGSKSRAGGGVCQLCRFPSLTGSGAPGVGVCLLRLVRPIVGECSRVFVVTEGGWDLPRSCLPREVGGARMIWDGLYVRG